MAVFGAENGRAVGPQFGPSNESGDHRLTRTGPSYFFTSFRNEPLYRPGRIWSLERRTMGE
jgi:hypothetical protein